MWRLVRRVSGAGRTVRVEVRPLREAGEGVPGRGAVSGEFLREGRAQTLLEVK